MENRIDRTTAFSCGMTGMLSWLGPRRSRHAGLVFLCVCSLCGVRVGVVCVCGDVLSVDSCGGFRHCREGERNK